MIMNKPAKAAVGAAAALLTAVGSVALTSTDAFAAGDGRITAKPNLAVRYAPTAQSSKVGSIAYGKVVPLSCKVTGSSVNGNRTWYQLPGDGGPEWIAARYVKVIGAAPERCGPDQLTKGRATASISVRKGPNTDNQRVRTVGKGGELNLRCKVYAENIGGNRLWYWTKGGNWVSARYVDNVGPAPQWCVES